jgi:hypothetical protein
MSALGNIINIAVPKSPALEIYGVSEPEVS